MSKMELTAKNCWMDFF